MFLLLLLMVLCLLLTVCGLCLLPLLVVLAAAFPLALFQAPDENNPDAVAPALAENGPGPQAAITFASCSMQLLGVGPLEDASC